MRRQGRAPYRVEAGYGKDDSLVTVMACYPPIENMDHWSASADEHMHWWGKIVSPLHNMGGPVIPHLLKQSPIVVVGPEHAALAAAANWGKRDFSEGLWKATQTSLSAWPSAAVAEKLTEMLGPLKKDTPVPIAESPKQILVFVGGGDGKQSHYFAPLPGSFPVSRVIAR